MASQSTVPTAKAAILAIIAARAGLATVQTEYGHPGKNIEKESVFLAAVEFEDEDVAAMRTAPHTHYETYTVPVWVDVLEEGNDPQHAEERMWAIVAEIEDGLRLAPDLSNPTVFPLGVRVRGKVPEEFESDMGRGVRCRINVYVKGRST